MDSLCLIHSIFLCCFVESWIFWHLFYSLLCSSFCHNLLYTLFSNQANNIYPLFTFFWKSYLLQWALLYLFFFSKAIGINLDTCICIVGPKLSANLVAALLKLFSLPCIFLIVWWPYYISYSHLAGSLRQLTSWIFLKLDM